MIKLPKRVKLANLPTQIEPLDRLTQQVNGPRIFLKRDDQTGSEISGNKVRKLEYAIKEALEQKCDYLITCGGIQSNHARATSAAAAKLGLKTFLVLKGDDNEPIRGNYFLDKILGADIKLISNEEYRERRLEIMEDIRDQLEQKGHKPYIIPEGASNGIGTFGYYKAMEEIIEQEKELGISFDAIVIAVGSGGTYSGLYLANEFLGHGADIIGINISENASHFKERIYEVLKESLLYIKETLEFTKDEISIIDGYVGDGYALSRPEELNFIQQIAQLEGVILDPVYTGKAMYGLVNEIKKGNMKQYKNILFIHTGGIFGLFPKSDLFF